jgi:endonuclease YncB( thermonuclease family)
MFRGHVTGWPQNYPGVGTDVVVDLEFADKRGSFFGTLALKNTKEDFGLMLVQNGLAEISVFNNKAPENIAELEKAEEIARSEGSGIWQKGLKLGASSSVKEVS